MYATKLIVIYMTLRECYVLRGVTIRGGVKGEERYEYSLSRYLSWKRDRKGGMYSGGDGISIQDTDALSTADRRGVRSMRETEKKRARMTYINAKSKTNKDATKHDRCNRRC